MARKRSEPSEEDLKLKTTWSSRLERGKRHQQENSKLWRENEKLIFGIDKEGDNEDDADLAYGWGLFKALETAIYVQDPDFYVESKFQANPDIARRLTDIIRTDVKDMDLKSTGGLMLLDTFVYGYGVGVEIIKTDQGFVRFPSDDPLVREGLVEEGDIAAIPKSQNYEIVRVHPKDILFDPKGTRLDLSDHGWVALAFYPTVASLQEDPSFTLPEKVDSLAESSQTTRNEKNEGTTGGRWPIKSVETDPAFKTICVWEIWDKPNQKIVYMTDSGHHVIGQKKWPCSVQIGPRSLFPVTMMAMHPNPKGFYPKAEVSLVRKQLDRLNRIEKEMDGYYRNRWRKHVAPASLLSNDTVSNFTDTSGAHSVILIEKDELDAFVGPTGNSAQLDLARLVVQLPDPMVPQDYYIRKQGIEQDISQILGYGPSDRGGLPQTRSAREAVMINDSKQQKLVKRADAIADFYRWICEKHLLMLQATMSVERAARKWEPAKGLGEWFRYDKEAIQGEFNFVVYAGSSGPRSTETKKQAELQMFQTVVPFLQAEGKSIYPALERLANVFGWEGIDQLFANGKMEMKNLAAAAALFDQDKVTPQMLLEQVARALQANLSNNDMNEVKQFLAQGISGAGGQVAAKGMRGDPGTPSAATGAM
jgi:hypothetical protein